jgi:class 3 adenylate cyclase
MKWIEATITYLFPSIMLEGKPWRSMWEEKERNTFNLVCRYFFLVAAILYLGHYYFYDKPMGLAPIEQWRTFRFGTAGLSFLAFVFYMSPLANARFYKMPAIFTCWVFCFTQALVSTWWDGTPWLFSFVFVAGSVIVFRTSPLHSVILASLIMSSQAPILIASGVPASSLVSTAFVTLLVILVLRTAHIDDIKNFVLNQENISAQKQIIELNIEFADRLRAFIPRVIARRLEDYVNQNRLTVLQAAVEVLKARRTQVACLFSDIRGYTQASKELVAFVDRSVLPEMKACSDKVEDHQGIPRKVGDLIFAYFDDESESTNILRAVAAGMDISRLNHDMNATRSESHIRRYILISSGEAIVGNLGGLDSSIEITALGPPVNFLSRLDDLTKHPAMIQLLNPGDLIVCEATHALLRELGVSLESQMIDLDQLEVSIRDFPEARTLYRIEPNDRNYDRLTKAYHCAKSDPSATDNQLRLTG